MGIGSSMQMESKSSRNNKWTSYSLSKNGRTNEKKARTILDLLFTFLPI